VKICSRSEALHNVLSEHIKPLLKHMPSEKLFQWADVVLVHWWSATESEELVKKYHKPWVLFAVDQKHPKLDGLKPDMVSFNSYWLQKASRYRGQSVVIHPPIYPEKYKTTRGNGVLLVQSLEYKGLSIFLKIAKKMPKYRFVLAQGRHKQPKMQLPANVEFVKRQPDVRDVYKKARIILMPSDESPVWQEGYGRVAIEAAASGIPCIGSSESRGIRECLGPDGLFVPRKNIQGWVDMIKKLDDPVFYAERSRKALELVEERHPDKYIDELERRLHDICNRLQGGSRERDVPVVQESRLRRDGGRQGGRNKAIGDALHLRPGRKRGGGNKDSPCRTSRNPFVRTSPDN